MIDLRWIGRLFVHLLVLGEIIQWLWPRGRDCIRSLVPNTECSMIVYPTTNWQSSSGNDSNIGCIFPVGQILPREELGLLTTPPQRYHNWNKIQASQIPI